MSKDQIWKKTATPTQLNAHQNGSLAEVLGIEVTEIGYDYIRATMPVDHRTRQPFGYLHGGASVALAETLGSVAGFLTISEEGSSVVGMEINANHIRAVRSGIVTGTARPVHIGSRTQVWETRIEDHAGRVVSVGRMTLAVVRRSSSTDSDIESKG